MKSSRCPVSPLLPVPCVSADRSYPMNAMKPQQPMKGNHRFGRVSGMPRRVLGLYTEGDLSLYAGGMAPRRKVSTRTRPLALGYVRVSTAEQVNEGASLDAQMSALLIEGERRRCDIEFVRDAGLSAKSLARPGLLDALDRLDRGEADVLIATRLDRLSRSVIDFAGLMERATKCGWSLVALDLGVDTSTAAGEMMANVLASFAQYERKIIGERTKAGMAQKMKDGVRMGRPVTPPTVTTERIRAERAEGWTFAAIADALNAECVPTSHGGSRWYPSSVRAASLAHARLSTPH